jgi:hypothetical protein
VQNCAHATPPNCHYLLVSAVGIVGVQWRDHEIPGESRAQEKRSDKTNFVRYQPRREPEQATTHLTSCSTVLRSRKLEQSKKQASKLGLS